MSSFQPFFEYVIAAVGGMSSENHNGKILQDSTWSGLVGEKFSIADAHENCSVFILHHVIYPHNVQPIN